MRNVCIIARRELAHYFTSPIAYLVAFAILVLTGWQFNVDLAQRAGRLPPDGAAVLGAFGFFTIFFAPLLTMRLFAEEAREGTLELLLTLPVRDGDIVLGKFVGAWLYYSAILALTLVYQAIWLAITTAKPYTISPDLDIGPVIGGYLGALLLGAAFAAVGLFASALTRSQIVAFLTGCAICFALCLVDQMAFFLPEAAARPLAHLAADLHFENIARGLVDTRDVLYFASLGFVALSATALVLHEKHA